MSNSQQQFLAFPVAHQAKKCADALRTVALRLGKDWKQTLRDYNRMAEWSGAAERCLDAERMDAVAAREHYRYWRTLAGLPLQRDMLAFPEENDRPSEADSALDWWVLAHNLRSAFNVGSIVRTCDCLGWAGVLLSGYSAPVSHPSVKSAAMGAELWKPCVQWESPLDALEQKRSQGYALVALELTEDAVPLPSFAWPAKGVLVLGNEELGVAPELLDLCSQKVFIPMFGRKGSLNVANAFAIAAAFSRTAK